MKFITALLLTALLAFTLGLQLPWYSIAIAAFIVAIVVPQKTNKTVLAGSLGIVLIWLLLCIISIINGSKSIAAQMAKIFPLGGSVAALVAVTVVIGGIVGALAALCGNYSRKLFT